jgi:hypothetical protein
MRALRGSLGKRLIAGGVTVLLLAGCSYTLRRPTTGTTVWCGTVPMPLWLWPYRRAEAEVFREVECVEYYQRQGYEQVPLPSVPRDPTPPYSPLRPAG